MDVYGGGEVVDLKVPEKRICPASNAEWIEVTRMVLAPAYTASRPGSEDPRCSKKSNGRPLEREGLGVGRGDSLERPGLA